MYNCDGQPPNKIVELKLEKPPERLKKMVLMFCKTKRTFCSGFKHS
jgi:hypothetical protein